MPKPEGEQLWVWLDDPAFGPPASEEKNNLLLTTIMNIYL